LNQRQRKKGVLLANSYLQVNKYFGVLYPKVYFRQASPLCYLLCVESAAE